jgi:hypothetical protein
LGHAKKKGSISLKGAFPMEPRQTRNLFSLGRILMTPGVEESIDRSDIVEAIGRHARGDWGELCADDVKQNEIALKVGDRLFSVFADERSTRFYVITEADRSVTTVLLPDEY